MEAAMGGVPERPCIIAPFIAGAALMSWWLRGIKSERRIDALEGRIAVFEDRLKFAAEKVVSANEARDDVIGQFQAYKADVAANAGNSVLAATAAKLEAALDKLATANNAVSSAISGAARISATTAMYASLSSTPLPLRQSESDKERPK
jgi:hypothetical protein